MESIKSKQIISNKSSNNERNNKMKSIICKIMVFAMLLSIFAMPTSAFAASPPQANEDKNRIEAPATVRANTVFKIKLVGDRSNVLKGTIEGETKYIEKSYDYYKNGNKTYLGLYESHFPDSLPRAYSDVIEIPGKYEIRGVFRLCEWIDYGSFGDWNTSLFLPKSITTKKIIVQGKTIFKSTKGGSIKSNQKKSKWMNPSSKIGALPKVKANKGYKFKGWYTKKKGGKKINKNTKVNFGEKSSKTYYAQFKKKK